KRSAVQSRWLGATYGFASEKRFTCMIAPPPEFCVQDARFWDRGVSNACSLEFLALLDPEILLRIDDRDEPHDAAVATLPVPGEERKRAAPPGDLVEIAADVLYAQNAVLEQDAVDRLPVREIRLPVAPAGPFLVFLRKVRMQRPVALRPDRSRERVIVRLRVVTDNFHLLLDEPLAGRGHEAGRIAEVVLAVVVLEVPAGVDEHDIARAHVLASGLLQIVVGDELPFLLRDRHHDAAAEEMRQWHLVDEGRPLHHVRGRID